MTMSPTYHKVGPWNNPESPIYVKEDIPDDALAKVPLLQQVKRLLLLAGKGKGIKLTTKGALPVTVVKEIYELGIPDSSGEYYSQLTEERCWPVMISKMICTESGLARNYDGRYSLTKKGQTLLDKSDRDLLVSVLNYVTTEMVYAYFDGYREFAYLHYDYIFLLMCFEKWGDEPKDCKFYAEKLLEKNSFWIEEASKASVDILDRLECCLTARFFGRYLDFLGVMDYTKKSLLSELKDIKKRPLFSELFGVRYSLEEFLTKEKEVL